MLVQIMEMTLRLGCEIPVGWFRLIWIQCPLRKLLDINEFLYGHVLQMGGKVFLGDSAVLYTHDDSRTANSGLATE
jgi:hypothetical protein